MMREGHEQISRPEPAADARHEALEKIKDFEKKSSYLEELYLRSGAWAERLRAAREKVPEALRNHASRFWLPYLGGSEQWEGGRVPPELRAYEAEVGEIMHEYNQFVQGQTDEQILEKANAEYDLAFPNDPERAWNVAGLFLENEKKILAAERVVSQSLESFQSSEDPQVRIKMVRAILTHHTEVSLPPQTWKEVIETGIALSGLDKYITDVLHMQTVSYLRERQGLPDSVIIYSHFRETARERIARSLHVHERRQELRSEALQLIAHGFLRRDEDNDLLNELFDKTSYERERDHECARLDAELAPLEFARYGIEKGKPVRLANLARLLRDKQGLVERGLRRNKYWHLRRNMFHHPPTRYGGAEFKREEFERARGRVRFKLGGETGLVFTFRMINKDRYRITQDDEFNEFQGTYLSKDDFVQSDITFTIDKSPYPDEEVPFEKIEEQGITERAVSGDAVFAMMREIMDTEVDCSRAIVELRTIARDLKLPKREIQEMIYAIGQYATYYKPPPISDNDCFNEIGRCLVQPNSFRGFCRKKFGFDVDTPTYGDGVSFYHEVNEWNGIVIDWTARQFGKYRDKAYPLIYAVTDAEKIGFGKLTSIEKEVRRKSLHKRDLAA